MYVCEAAALDEAVQLTTMPGLAVAVPDATLTPVGAINCTVAITALEAADDAELAKVVPLPTATTPK